MKLALAAAILIPVVAALAGRVDAARELVLRLLALLQLPVRHTLQIVQRVVAWLYSAVKAIFSDGEEQTWTRVLGAYLYTAIAIVCVGGDFWPLAQTLEAMGLVSGVATPPLSVHILLAAALVGVLAFWGLVLTDLAGLTHFGTWHRLSPRNRRLLKIAAILIALTGIALFAAMGYWRGWQVGSAQPVEPIAPPESAIVVPLGPQHGEQEIEVDPVAPEPSGGAMAAKINLAIAGLVATTTLPALGTAKQSIVYTVGIAIAVMTGGLALLASLLDLVMRAFESVFSFVEQLLVLIGELGGAIRTGLAQVMSNDPDEGARVEQPRQRQAAGRSEPPADRADHHGVEHGDDPDDPLHNPFGV